MRLLEVPFVGWAELEQTEEVGQWFRRGRYFFCHGFGVPAELVDENFRHDRCVSFVEKGNVIGLQFHPEKSQSDGRKLLLRIFDKGFESFKL